MYILALQNPSILILCMCTLSIARALDVTILTSPSSSNYQVGSPVNLTCAITSGYTAPAFYTWSSTCTGNCAIPGSEGSTVYLEAIHSADIGTHTCSVTDDAGNSGSATMQLSVFGKSTMHVSLSVYITYSM